MLAHRSAVSVGTKPIVQNVLRAIRSRVRTLPSRESIRIISDSLPQVARSGSTHSDKFFRLAHIFLPSFLSITGAAVSVYICKGMWETACKAAKHIVALELSELVIFLIIMGLELWLSGNSGNRNDKQILEALSQLLGRQQGAPPRRGTTRELEPDLGSSENLDHFSDAELEAEAASLPESLLRARGGQQKAPQQEAPPRATDPRRRGITREVVEFLSENLDHLSEAELADEIASLRQQLSEIAKQKCKLALHIIDLERNLEAFRDCTASHAFCRGASSSNPCSNSKERLAEAVKKAEIDRNYQQLREYENNDLKFRLIRFKRELEGRRNAASQS